MVLQDEFPAEQQRDRIIDRGLRGRRSHRARRAQWLDVRQRVRDRLLPRGGHTDTGLPDLHHLRSRLLRTEKAID